MSQSHSHAQTHTHTPELRSLNKAFIIGIILNLIFVFAEFGAGLWFDSLALLADAGHNLSDVVSLVLALLAFRLAKVKANNKYTYGYKKSTILVSLLNAIILFIAVGGIFFESIGKFHNPTEVPGTAIAGVAGIGVLINGFTAYLFIKEKDRDLNVKGAYLHMAADALVSVGVVISGIVINYTGWYIIDPLLGIIIAIVILLSTFSLLHDSIRLSMDGVPSGIQKEEIEELIRELPEVRSIYHIHIWAISTTENALTAHVVISNYDKMEEIKEEIRHRLETHNITHATLEFEKEGTICNRQCELQKENI